MKNSEIIQAAIASVSELRLQAARDTLLKECLIELKQYQSARFARTYQDLLKNPHYCAAACFFLEDLYGVKDFSTRDQQFSKIAGIIDKLFPKHVVAVAVTLAQLHALSEELDFEMAKEWSRLRAKTVVSETLYEYCWKSVGRRQDRERQLAMTLAMGKDLSKLTKLAGLRMLLRMMRRPAELAGLSALQHFLESGFDTFAEMANDSNRSSIFLKTIEERETEFIGRLYR